MSTNTFGKKELQIIFDSGILDDIAPDQDVMETVRQRIESHSLWKYANVIAVLASIGFYAIDWEMLRDSEGLHDSEGLRNLRNDVKNTTP